MDNSRVLIVGSGGREHAIAKALSISEHKPIIYCYGTNYNPGIISLLSDKSNIRVCKEYDCRAITDFALANQITYVVIGPEKLLYLGLADHLKTAHIGVIGPTSLLARIETSKLFTRGLMGSALLSKYNPKLRVFTKGDDIDEPINFIKSLNGDYVIKANGLHSGKGVKLYPDHLKTLSDSVKYIFELNERGEDYLIEERLYGEEYTIMSFCDGSTFRHMPPCKDFKRRDPYDLGPNTGSMGSITYANHLLPTLVPADLDISYEIVEKAIRTLMDRYDDVYCGIVYGSFIKTHRGDIKLIEFNARFGDPECINLLHILETDLHEIFMNMLNNTLSSIIPLYKREATIFKYLIPPEYPDKPSKTRSIKLYNGGDSKSHIYAGIDQIDTRFYTTGSRTMGVIYSSTSMSDAYNKVESEIMKYVDPLLDYRYDIGSDTKNKNSYKSSGVDVEKMDKAILKIKGSIEKTHNSSVLSRWGDFAGLFSLKDILTKTSESPLLVASTDGVGTKNTFVLKSLGEEGAKICGRDIVNHCINDILVKGAKPLFFLDYFASSSVNPNILEKYVKGISDACLESGVALLGGETAEMPSTYVDGHCDMVGTIVGVVESKSLIDGKNMIMDGDMIYALRSSGPHTNGYSLIRRVVDDAKGRFPESVIDMLLQPHRSYYSEISTLIENDIPIHGLVHITGGGYRGNVKRILPKNLIANFKQWHFQEPFYSLQLEGNISTDEMLDTFNCGYGMLIITDRKYEKNIQELLSEGDVIGKIEPRLGDETVIFT